MWGRAKWHINRALQQEFEQVIQRGVKEDTVLPENRILRGLYHFPSLLGLWHTHIDIHTSAHRHACMCAYINIIVLVLDYTE